MRELNLSSSVKTEPGVKKEGRLETLKRLAYSFFAGGGKYCISKADNQIVWLGDSTNQLWKIDEQKDSRDS